MGGMVASALAAASFGRRRRKREVALEEVGKVDDLMEKLDNGMEEVVAKLENKQESGMLQDLLNMVWKSFVCLLEDVSIGNM